MVGIILGFFFTVIGAVIVGIAIYFLYWQYQRNLREAKNYERGLKMVPLLIHLPPSGDDIELGSRDSRDVTEESISQAQSMYNIISSTATKGFKSKVFGQRHIAFEIVCSKGLIHYYVAVPFVLLEVIKQAVIAAYPTARLEESEESNIFSPLGKITGTIGGEISLKREFAYPIATFQESKRDAMQALLNAMSTLGKDDGASVQILLRPAHDKWAKASTSLSGKIRKDKGSKSGFSLISMREVAEALWKPPENKEVKPEEKQLTTLEQSTVDAIDDKTRYPGYEVLIRVMASSNTAARSQAILKNIVAYFSLLDSPSKNGFKYTPARNIDTFVTAFIFRFFPQEANKNILNSVELATLFHFPDARSTPSSQVQRQATKQVDGPSQDLTGGTLLGYNLFRGMKKEIRLADTDRRRHVYIIGQTGTGKSNLLENLALQDMLDGKGFAFVDPHGDSVDRLMGMVPKERIEDVIYFSPGDLNYPVGLNLFEFETEEQKDFLIQEAIQMLYRLYDPGHTGIIGPRYEHWFRNAALTIMSDPNGTSFIDIPQVFNDNDFSKAKLKYVRDQTVLDFWNKEMAQTSDYHKSEVLGWFVSKFGAFLSNEMMRNIIGQTKSGFNLRDIMDNKKILFVNLSKGKTGELNSQLLGMIFVMKFQAAAMGRADIPEDQRVDFSLYVDEFQNFATESFENILSEARKYRLNLILANQFMTQLTDKIREAIIGNVGTIISGRIGTTDAELMAKRFMPTFDSEDLAKLPNFETVATVMINNVPSSPFSMSLLPPLGKPNPDLANALKRLSSAKYGRPRNLVEKEIFSRLRAGDEAKKLRQEAASKRLQAMNSGSGVSSSTVGAASAGSSFLDEWLAKKKQKQQISATPSLPRPTDQMSTKTSGISSTPPKSPTSTLAAHQPFIEEDLLGDDVSPMAVESKAAPASMAKYHGPKESNKNTINKPTNMVPNLPDGSAITIKENNLKQQSTDLNPTLTSDQVQWRVKPIQDSEGTLVIKNRDILSSQPSATNQDEEIQLEQAIGAARSSAAMKQDVENEEEESKNKLEEIYIDLSGELHHKNDSSGSK